MSKLEVEAYAKTCTARSYAKGFMAGVASAREQELSYEHYYKVQNMIEMAAKHNAFDENAAF